MKMVILNIASEMSLMFHHVVYVVKDTRTHRPRHTIHACHFRYRPISIHVAFFIMP